jgi:CBS domain-containing protein
MQCSTLMKADVECCQLDDSVEYAAQRMAERNIGFIPICNELGQVVGTVTDRDIVLRVVAQGLNPAVTTLQDVCTPDVVACAPQDDLGIAEGLMSKHKKSRIICLDADQHLAGVISLSDIARIETGARSSAILRSVAQREARL